MPTVLLLKDKDFHKRLARAMCRKAVTLNLFPFDEKGKCL